MELQDPPRLLRENSVSRDRKSLRNILNKQNIAIAREIPLSSQLLSKKSGELFKGSIFTDPGNTMKLIQMKHEKEGVMRRNKLLLEQILNERLGDNIHNSI